MIEQTRPEGVTLLSDFTAQLDQCFLNGFVGTQYEVLPALARIFSGTPLEGRINASIQALSQNEFVETHFATLAAARCALQGTTYDLLYRHLRSMLGRQTAETAPPQQPASVSHPLLDSTRHWLMELALTGFSRLEPDMVQSFTPTLVQMRANPQFFYLSALLTGFVNELMAKDPENLPLSRWGDLWSTAMLRAAGTDPEPDCTPVSGTLYPLGVNDQAHSHTFSVTGYGMLVHDQGARFVRTTWSSFKVAAIQEDEMWLLVPEAQTFTQALAQGKALTVKGLPLLSSGHLLWDENSVETGKKFKLMETALQYCGAGVDVCVPHLPPLERHPVQIAEPVALSVYTVKDNTLHLSDGSILPLDPRGLAADTLTDTVFGFVRYSDDGWTFQALTSGSGVFYGQGGADLLKKPPKNSTVSILKERASRLLRG